MALPCDIALAGMRIASGGSFSLFVLLLKIRLLSAANVVRETLQRSPLVAVGLGLLGVALFGGMTAGFWIFFGFASKLNVLAETVYQIFYFLFLFLLAGAVPFVASTLLHSSDYELLFASPAPPRTVVAAKILDATLTNSLQFSILGIPAIVACAAAAGIQVWFWLLVPLFIGLFVLVPALITAFALLVALAILGMSRLRSAITTLNAAMALLVCATIVLEAGHLPVRPSAFGTTLMSLQPTTLASTSFTAHHAPSTWFADILLSVAGTNPVRWDVGALALLKVTLLVAVLYGAAMALGGKLLSAANLAEEQSRRGSSVAGADRQPGWILRNAVPAPVAAMLTKDLKYLARDSVLLSQLTMPMILFCVPFLLAFQDPGLRQRDEIFPFVTAMIGVILFMQTSILSLSALGLDGQSFWVPMTAPNALRMVLWSKFMFSTLLSVAVGVSLTLFSWLTFGIALNVIVIQLGLIIFSSAGLCGLGVGLSGAFPRFVYENPAHRVSAWALILGFFATTGYILFSGLLFGAGWFFTSAMGPSMQTVLTWIVCVLLYLIVTGFAIYIPMELGSRRLERYQWEH